MSSTRTTKPFVIPPLIKKNTTLFALSQSFTGAGMQFAFGLGPLMVIALTGSATLAGLSVGLIGLSRFLVSYPVGKITDTYGRKPGILFGLSLGLVGGLIVGAAMIGPGVEHLAHLMTVAVQEGWTAAAFLDRPFYHPTLEEGLQSAVKAVAERTGGTR